MPRPCVMPADTWTNSSATITDPLEPIGAQTSPRVVDTCAGSKTWQSTIVR